jgi:hypothetical protein
MLMLVDGIRAVALRRTLASDSGGTLILVKTADGLVAIDSGAAIFNLRGARRGYAPIAARIS